MTYRVVILSRAACDIEANAKWWAEAHSVDQAISWFDAVHAQIKTLSDLPTRCALSIESDRFAFEIREKLVGLGSRPGYRAIFTIVDDTVFVLTVRRASQRELSPSDIDAPPIE